MGDVFKFNLALRIVVHLSKHAHKTFWLSLLAKDLNVAFASCCIALKKLESGGYVSFRLVGRRRIVLLTRKGASVGDLFYKAIMLDSEVLKDV